MMAFPGMLLDAAQKAGMKTPDEYSMKQIDDMEFDKNKYPHFFVFCLLQLARPMNAGEHWENAEIIAKIDEKKILTMTLADFLNLGLRWQQ